ncbi:MAG: hypothetical protein ACREIQ_10535, partial [Nitrospiria bacterium]
MFTFELIDSLVELVGSPINGEEWLESLQDKFDEHHNYYRFLYLLTLTWKPKVALEIGTKLGIGSAY